MRDIVRRKMSINNIIEFAEVEFRPPDLQQADRANEAAPCQPGPSHPLNTQASESQFRYIRPPYENLWPHFSKTLPYSQETKSIEPNVVSSEPPAQLLLGDRQMARGPQLHVITKTECNQNGDLVKVNVANIEQ